VAENCTACDIYSDKADTDVSGVATCICDLEEVPADADTGCICPAETYKVDYDQSNSTSADCLECSQGCATCDQTGSCLTCKDTFTEADIDGT
jgi:ferredoxin-like protein FixX